MGSNGEMENLHLMGLQHRGEIVAKCKEKRKPMADDRVKVDMEYEYVNGMIFKEYYYKDQSALDEEDKLRPQLSEEDIKERKQMVKNARKEFEEQEKARFRKLDEAILKAKEQQHDDQKAKRKSRRRLSLAETSYTNTESPGSAVKRKSDPFAASARDDSTLSRDLMDSPAMQRAKERVRQKQLLGASLGAALLDTSTHTAGADLDPEAEKERKRREKERKKKEKERKKKEKEKEQEKLEKLDERMKEIEQRRSELIEENLKNASQMSQFIGEEERARRKLEERAAARRAMSERNRKDLTENQPSVRVSQNWGAGAKKKKEEEEQRRREEEQRRNEEEADAKRRMLEVKKTLEKKKKKEEAEKAKKKADKVARDILRKAAEKKAKLANDAKEQEKKRKAAEANRKRIEKAIKKAKEEARYITNLEVQPRREGQRHRQKSKMNLQRTKSMKGKKNVHRAKSKVMTHDGKEKERDNNQEKTLEPVRMTTLKGLTLDTSETYTAPQSDLTEEEKELLKKKFADNPALNGLIPSQINHIINAFERVEIKPGEELAKQGSQDDSLFIVRSGDVNFKDQHGNKVGGATAGNTFGESALTYAGTRSVTVEADTQKTIAYKLKHQNYRHIVREQILKSEGERIRLLKWVPFFQLVDGPDLKILTNAMKPHQFKKGENLTKTFGEFPFCCLVYEGTVALDPELFPDPESDGLVRAGGAFGEAFSGGADDSDDESESDSEPYDVKGETDGVVYTIDRKNFELVFGSMDKLAAGKTDKQKLAEIPAIKAASLSDEQMDTLVRQISDIKFPANREVFTKGKSTQPNLYLLREGQVKLTDGIKKIITPGACFGHDHFKLSDDEAPKKVTATHTATAGVGTTFGVLKLPDLAAIIGKARAEVARKNELMKKDIPLGDLERHRILGEGQYGIVWLVTNKKSKELEPYALKIQLLNDPDRENPVECIKQEIEVMQEIQSPFIIKVLSTYEEPESISMLLSLAPGGELFDIIHQEDEDGTWTSGIGEENAKFYATVISDSIAFLHRQHYVFRDLKPENVLIDASGYPVITDFGFAKKVVDTKTYTFCGTPNYVAPEIISNRGHDITADNWTLGVLIYELIEGENPFYDDGMDQTTLFHAICHDPYYPFPEGEYTDLACDLLDRLLEKDPARRLGTFRESDILAHAWFNDYDIMELREKKVEAPWVPDPLELEEEE